MIKNLIFDFDGALADTSPLILAAIGLPSIYIFSPYFFCRRRAAEADSSR